MTPAEAWSLYNYGLHRSVHVYDMAMLEGWRHTYRHVVKLMGHFCVIQATQDDIQLIRNLDAATWLMTVQLERITQTPVSYTHLPSPRDS